MRKFLWLAVYLGVLVWSGINPKDTFTWALEVAPAAIGLMVLAVTRQSFPLTPLLYGLILIHAIVLMIGGHYTYAEVPLFDSMRSWFGFERNNYDKIGHFMQGFMPAILAREIVIRKDVVGSQSWMSFFVVCICLAFSAFYELIEWLVATITGESAEAFLGTQGFAWDTQTDMALALIGAVAALLFLSAMHNKQVKQFVGSGW